jgi:hypothetical protein
MTPSSLSRLRTSLVIALAPFAIAACDGTLGTPTADAGADANASLPSNDAGLDSTQDGTLLDGNVLNDASTPADATDALPAPDDASSDASSDTGSDASGDATSDANAGPEILSLSETVSSITQGGSFTVIAIVTDPQGLSNLAGGQLASESGAVLGAFVPTTQGTYSLTVSWAQLNAAAAVNFTGQTTVSNRATFYDAQGRQTSQGLPIELYCGSAAAPNAACAGQCVNLTSVDSCGSCAASCADAGGIGAEEASCEAPGQCAWGTLIGLTTPSETCASQCASGGGTCVAAQTTPAYSTSAIPETCSSSPSSVGGSIEVTTVVITIGCDCEPSGGVIPKTQTGSCASVCANLSGSQPCYSTVLWVTAYGGAQQEVSDTCSAPYAVGTGTVWDGLVQADLPANETVMSPPSWINCQCEGAAP